MAARLLVLSDIHANLPALTAVLEDAEKRGPYGVRLNTGDAVGYGSDPNECIQMLRDRDFISIKGNHEEAVIDKTVWSFFNFMAAEALKYTVDALTDESRKWIDGLSNLYVDPMWRFALVHGSFAGAKSGNMKGRREGIYVDSENQARLAMRAMVVDDDDNPPTYIRHIPLGFFGHTHIPTVANSWVGFVGPYFEDFGFRLALSDTFEYIP